MGTARDWFLLGVAIKVEVRGARFDDCTVVPNNAREGISLAANRFSCQDIDDRHRYPTIAGRLTHLPNTKAMLDGEQMEGAVQKCSLIEGVCRYVWRRTP